MEQDSFGSEPKRGLSIYTQADLSCDLISLFRKKYENYVLMIMNNSKVIFPSEYEYVQDQAHGECDYIDVKTGERFDAKLPFNKEQVELLTSGKKHLPKIGEWIDQLREVAAGFDINKTVSGAFDKSRDLLLSTIESRIEKEKEDENIVLFFPFPIVLDVSQSVFLQFASDYLDYIYDQLNRDGFAKKRSIYVIYPSDVANLFAVRKLGDKFVERIECKELGRFFTYQTKGFSVVEFDSDL